MPRDFNLTDLEAVSFTLAWKDGAFIAEGPGAGPVPARRSTPRRTPRPIAQLVQRVGKASREAARVEVPFEYIAPPSRTTCGRRCAAAGFDVPIGRAGATRRQSFSLGRGTAQHALVAGKTGSGKSTLLHALITNLALTYSPDEVELYLIDFKKGVEFKGYATHRLPHARVVAIESEREFGLSVLQRLDGILKERGDKFRDAGVNDLAGYRAAQAEREDARASCSSSTSSRSSSSRTTSSRRKRRCCSTASSGRAGRSACTSCSARRRSAGRTRSPAAPSTRWRCASRCSAPTPTRS